MQEEKKNIKRTFIKAFGILMLSECLWLFCFPFCFEKLVNSVKFKNYVNRKAPVSVDYNNVGIKTHILPFVDIKTNKAVLREKETGDYLFSFSNPKIRVSVLPLMSAKLNLKKVYFSDFAAYITVFEDGEVNLVKIFKTDKKSLLKIRTNNTKILSDEYNVRINDLRVGKETFITGVPIEITKKKHEISVVTKGDIETGNSKSDFDIDLKSKIPFNAKNFAKNSFKGKLNLYDIDLKSVEPFVKAYISEDITKLSGNIEKLNINFEPESKNIQKAAINAKFTDAEFDKKGWQNHIVASGENRIEISADIGEKLFNVTGFKYNAENINVESSGTVDFKEDKPALDIKLEVKNSRTENLAAILPPTLVPEFRTIEKMKHYGVYGDISGEVQFKGKVPQPNVTGYVQGRNIRILDEKIQKLHKGTVDIEFKGRTLNMGIVIDMPENQKANVDGYVYMYRDGVNNAVIKTTENLDFPLAAKLAVPISKVFNFMLGPVPEMNITSGKGVIDVDVKGSIDSVSVNGYCAFDKANLTYNGLYADMRNGKGRVDFKDDIISVKTERLYVKDNFVNIDGRVKINENLDFNVSSRDANGVDVLEIINNSELLTDVKRGMAIITKASGKLDLFVNMKANIVPVPYGAPPLPPEEAFTDIKVKGHAILPGDIAYMEGFRVPLENVRGRVDFTEEEVNLNKLTAVSGTSGLNITGKIVTDINTKIPDADITITSDKVNLKDTIKFLTESYLYPPDYPDISALYKIASKHDLYFKYKAKSIDFLPEKAYAVMNFISDDSSSPLVAKSGKIVMDKAVVRVENVIAKLFEGDIKIKGTVRDIDKPVQIYNLDVHAQDFDIADLNNISELEIVPCELKNMAALLKDYEGIAKLDIGIKNNYPKGKIDIKTFGAKLRNSDIPITAHDFSLLFDENKIYANNFTGNFGGMPIFADINITDIYKNQKISGYYSAKPTNEIIQKLLPAETAKTVTLVGDINLSGDLSGTLNNMNIKPKLTLNKDADIRFETADIGETTDKREFNADINITPREINVKKLDYIKYIESHNNKTNPILFATGSGKFGYDENNELVPYEMKMKTEKNLSAKILNVFLKSPFFRQGHFNADLVYRLNPITKIHEIKGEAECKNLDIPLFDTIVKNIKLDADDKDINLSLSGFLSDSRISLNGKLANDLSKNPEIRSIEIKADVIDNDKLLQSMSKVHNAMNTNNQIKNFDLSGLTIKNGKIDIGKMIVKSMTATNITGDFSVDASGVFYAQNVNIDVGEGNLRGELAYNLLTGDSDVNMEVKNVDANYISETLFEAKNQIYGSANGKLIMHTSGFTDEEKIKNLSGFIMFEINDGRMPRLGSLEYLLRASNIIKSGITGFTINSILELLNLVKSGYFSNIIGSCTIEEGETDDLEIFSTGDNLSMYIHGKYDLATSTADMEILGKLSKNISTIFGAIGNTSINTLFKMIPGVSLINFRKKDIIEEVEKIPSFTNGDYDARVFRAVVFGDINETSSVKSFKWVRQ